MINKKAENNLKDLKTENKRMDKSDDALRKMSHAYLGKTTHEYFGLPGEYKRNIENEFPSKDGEERRNDGAYIVENNGEEMIISMEDESSIVNKKALAKSYGYCVNMQYAYKLPVYSAITTPIPLNKCTKVYCPSETLKFLPRIISFNEFDGEERLEYARAKIDKNETFSDIECYDLINIPKMFDENRTEVLEEVCNIFSKIKIEDKEEKFRLTNCLKCVINKYAETIEDINRLIEVIDMVKVTEDTRQIVRDVFKEELEEASEKAEEKGMEKGIKKERVNLARKFAERFNIDEVAEISGLTKEQILQPNTSGK